MKFTENLRIKKKYFFEKSLTYSKIIRRIYAKFGSKR